LVKESEDFDKEKSISNSSFKGVKIDVIIDGTNVAFDNVPKGESPRCENLELALNYYTKQNLTVRVIVDASLRHKIDEKHILENALDSMIVAQSPAGVQADEYILKLALLHPESKIVSNDTFDNWAKSERRDLEDVKKNVLSKKERFIRFKINGQFIEFKNYWNT
jgi:hypothetical protein